MTSLLALTDALMVPANYLTYLSTLQIKYIANRKMIIDAAAKTPAWDGFIFAYHFSTKYMCSYC